MKIVCPQCKSEVTNEFNNTLTFCTNCGGQLSLANETLSKTQSQFPTILLTSLLTSIIILTLVGIGLYAYFSFNSGERNLSKNKEKTLSPTPPTKQKSLVPASEIVRVSYTTWQHQGPLTSGTGSVVSKDLTFSRDLTARKTSGTNYDDGQTKNRSSNFEGQIDTGHFEKLAEIIVDNDFLNLPDSKERVSEGDAFLVITYQGGEKKILTSNIGKDIPEVAEIIKNLNILDSAVSWKEVK